MTIKEIEILTGMTRANIRFYESEGLIAPQRTENGYREYSEQDLDILKKIKLLRNLQISLDDIKKLHKGEATLDDTLTTHIQSLLKKASEMEKAKDVCLEMKADQAEYSDLDASRYLEHLQVSTYKSNISLQNDVEKIDPIPIKRALARAFDFSLYQIIIYSFFALVCNVNITMLNIAESLFFTFFILVMMLVIESVLLAKAGTTPGKWILGIRVLDYHEEKLSIYESFQRTSHLIWYGLGFMLPVYSLIRLVKSYNKCNAKKELEWETDSRIYTKPFGIPRAICYVGSYLFICLFLVLMVNIAEMPKNRGEISVEEFKENYDKYAKYNKLFVDNLLEKNQQDHLNDLFIEMTERPEFTFVEKEGRLSEVCLNLQVKNTQIMISPCQDEMLLSVLSFVFAQENRLIPSKEVQEIIQYISEHSFTDFHFETKRYIINCAIENEGYENIEGLLLVLPETDESEYSFVFEIKEK